MKHIWPIFLTIILLQGCMPDSMTKWEEQPPVKDDAPIISDLVPANLSYSTSLGSTSESYVVQVDVGNSIPNLIPNSDIVGNENGNLTFSISPSLPNGISFNTSTGLLSGTPTVDIDETPFTVTATNLTDSTTTIINIEVTIPETIKDLTYAELPESETITLATGATIDVSPTITGTADSWAIAPNLAAYVTIADIPTIYPAECENRLIVIPGVCFNETSGDIFGAPINTQPAIPYTVTATKLSPASTDTHTFSLEVQATPVNLYYTQSGIVELSLSSLTTGLSTALASANYVQLRIEDATSPAFGQTVEATISAFYESADLTSIIVEKYDSSKLYTNEYSVVGYGNTYGVYTPIATPPSILSITNILEPNKSFEFTPLMVDPANSSNYLAYSGTGITYSLGTEVLEEDTFATFLETLGIISGRYSGDVEERTITVTAENKVGSSIANIKISPMKLQAQRLSFSQNILVRVQDASSFEVGDSVSSVAKDDSISRGIVFDKFEDPLTRSHFLIVSVEQNSFSYNDAIDNVYPYQAEETNISGYSIIEVDDSTTMSVGDFFSSDNGAFGKIRRITGNRVYVVLLNGIFLKDDTVRNIFPYEDTVSNPGYKEALVVSSVDDDHIAPFTATLAISIPALATAPSEGDLIVQGTSEGEVKAVETLTMLNLADTSAFEVGGYVSQQVVAGTQMALGIVKHIDTLNDNILIRTLSEYPFENTAGEAISNELSFTGGVTTINVPITDEYYFVYSDIYRGAIVSDTGSVVTIAGNSRDLHFIQAPVLKSDFTKDSAIALENGISIAEVDSGATGDAVGYVNHIISYDSSHNYMYFTAVNGTFETGMEFDTLNPILQGRASYHSMSKISSTKSFYLKRGTPFTFTKSIYKNVNATYTISPSLPAGLELKEDGTFSGTPTTASAFKSYTIKATSDRGAPTTFTFNLKVEEYFGVYAVAEEDTYSASYITHRQGKKNNSRACQVTKEQSELASYEERDVVCRVEAEELDVYSLGMKFNIEIAPGMCNHLEVKPFYYYSHRFRGNSDPGIRRYYNATSTCVLTDDIDGDGTNDVNEDLNSDGILDPGEDIDLDGNLDVNETPSSGPWSATYDNVSDFLVAHGNNMLVGFDQTSDVSDIERFCQSNFTNIEGSNCDEGQYALYTISMEARDDSTACSPNPEEAIYAELDCGGSNGLCQDGPARVVLGDEDFTEGKRLKLFKYASDEPQLLTVPIKSPISLGLSDNRFITDYFVNHSYYNIGANRDENYTFDIKKLIRDFSSGEIYGFNDPMSGGYPTYTFSCLKASGEPVARIHVQVRNWDTQTNVRGPIDRNNKLIEQTSAVGIAQGSNTVALPPLTDMSQFEVGMNFLVGYENRGYQLFNIASISGTNITTTSAATRTFTPTPGAGFGDKYHFPPQGDYTLFDDGMKHYYNMMDTYSILNQSFDQFFNQYGDWDDYNTTMMTPNSASFDLSDTAAIPITDTFDFSDGDNLSIQACDGSGVPEVVTYDDSTNSFAVDRHTIGVSGTVGHSGNAPYCVTSPNGVVYRASDAVIAAGATIDIYPTIQVLSCEDFSNMHSLPYISYTENLFTLSETTNILYDPFTHCGRINGRGTVYNINATPSGSSQVRLHIPSGRSFMNHRVDL